MIFAAIPVVGEGKWTSDVTKFMTFVSIFIVLGIIIAVIVLYVIKRRNSLRQKSKPPVVQFNLAPRIAVEESIDFVVPDLQKPRKLKAGVGIFEPGSVERLQRSLHEPMARAYRPPTIGFAIVYDRANSRSLTVRLSGAKDISPSKLCVNPIVKVMLQPDKIVHVSRLQKNTTRPVFGDVFQFEVPEDVNIETRLLKFTLYDQNKLGKRVLGRAIFHLNKTMHQNERWLALAVPRKNHRAYGEVTVQLQQTDASFTCSLLSVREIPREIRVHVKLGAYVNHKLYKKVRSASFQALGKITNLKGEIELLKSDFDLNDLSTLQIVVSLHSRKKRLAKCHIGPRSSVEGMEHWAEMLVRNKAIKAHRFCSG